MKVIGNQVALFGGKIMIRYVPNEYWQVYEDKGVYSFVGNYDTMVEAFDAAVERMEA